MWTSAASSALPSAPPRRPVSATTFIPRSWAARTAATTFAELPLVEIASRQSLRLSEREDLFREHLVIVVVVRDRGERRRVRGKRQGGKPGALALEAVEQLRREVLRIRGGAAVAAGENLAVRQQATAP